MKITEEEIARVVAFGNWMLRRSDAGKSYNGFQWAPIGEWTEAPDWDPSPRRGGGLHGNGPASSGFWNRGKDLDFCEIDPAEVVNLGDKIKVRRARVLLRNRLPEGLSVEGNLDLQDTQIVSLPEGLRVGGSLDLRDTQIKELPEGLQVGGDLDLRGTQITSLPEGLQVGGWLDLRGTQIRELPKDLQVGGEIYGLQK